MSNGMSVSMHCGSKDNAIKNLDKIKYADKHNNRKYTNYKNEDINKDLIDKNVILVGTNNAENDIKEFYKKEFSEAVYQYNKNQPDERRKVIDYLDKMEKDKKSNIAVEFLFQIGNTEDWKDKTIEEKQKTIEIFKKAIPLLEKRNIKCFSAVVHLDETNPHMHLLAVPVIDNQKRGLSKQVSQNKVITPKVLEELRKEVEDTFITEYNKAFNDNKTLKKGSEIPYHLKIDDYKKIKNVIEVAKKVKDKVLLKEAIEQDYKKITDEVKEKEKETNFLTNQLTKLEKEKTEKKQDLEKIKEDIKNIDSLRIDLKQQNEDIEKLKADKDSNNSIIEMYKNNAVETREKIDNLKKEFNKLEDERLEKERENQEQKERIRSTQETILKDLENAEKIKEERKKRLKELEEENTALQEKIKVVESNIKVYSNQLTKLETEEKELVSTVEIRREQKDNKDKKKQLNKLLRILKNDDNITEETIYKTFKNLEIYNKETAIDFIEDIKRDNYITINNIDDETFQKIKNLNDYYDDDFGFNKEKDDFEIGFKF